MTLGYYSDNPNGFVTGKLFSVDLPCVTVMRAGMGGNSLGHWHLIRDWRNEMPQLKQDKNDKPPYRVPLMSEIAAVPRTGLIVASTFSGCGGSCTGYRMAGFRVAWANEFVPAAQDSYLANCAEDSFLDRRDIKLVKPEDVLKQLGIKKGQLDLFDGSPPCQAFSTAGKRHKGWGQKKSYEGGHEQLNETLFGEWLRLLRGLMPRTFVAENVSGLVKGVCKGTFLEILAEMKTAGYRVSARVLDAQWLGVPQQRQRVIFVGVREDLTDAATGAPLQPGHPSPLPVRYSVREAIPWISSCQSGPTGFGVGSLRADASAPTIGASAQAPYSKHQVTRIVQQQDAPGIGKKPVSDARPLPSVCSSQAQQFVLNVAGQRVDQGEVIDLQGCLASEWEATPQGSASDKYFNLVRQSQDAPCSSVTAVGGRGGGRGTVAVCHPTERRKFTIAELRRLCAFPDDFVLTGSYAQQWERLGNSVPPVMAFWIARSVREVLFAADGREPWTHDSRCLTAVAEARKS